MSFMYGRYYVFILKEVELKTSKVSSRPLLAVTWFCMENNGHITDHVALDALELKSFAIRKKLYKIPDYKTFTITDFMGLEGKMIRAKVKFENYNGHKFAQIDWSTPYEPL